MTNHMPLSAIEPFIDVIHVAATLKNVPALLIAANRTDVKQHSFKAAPL